MVDSEVYRAQMQATWDAGSAGWAAWDPVLERGAGAVAERLLDLAGVGPGHRVLDVATGHGEPALSAAMRTGAAGRVLGIDLSPAMLARARERAEGLPWVEFREGDMESTGLDGQEFDAVVSRFGVMLALDPAAMFARLRKALAPGGKLAVGVWGPPATHLLATAPRIIGERLSLPAPPAGTPTPFSLADRQYLADCLAKAGFTEVSVVEQIAPYRFDSMKDYLEFNRSVLPAPLVEAADAQDAWSAVAEALADRVEPGGALPLPSLTLCACGVAPPAGA